MSEADRSPEPPTVVLVRTTEQGNIGAAARAMANLGLSKLILVDPAAPIGEIARARAVGAGFILDGIERHRSLAEALAPFRLAVGTTSSRSRALAGRLIGPRELPARLAEDPAAQPVALVFGPESSGLDNDELALCSLLVRIPSSPVQPTFNLAQAVLLVAYELFTAGLPKAETELDESDPAATVAEIEMLFEHLRAVLPAIGFARDDTARGVIRDLRKLAARSGLSSREATILRGLCRRTERALERRAR
jgi:TrmH family RNA methyltransferase